MMLDAVLSTSRFFAIGLFDERTEGEFPKPGHMLCVGLIRVAAREGRGVGEESGPGAWTAPPSDERILTDRARDFLRCGDLDLGPVVLGRA